MLAYDLTFLLLLLTWSAGFGLWLLRRFGPLPESPADTLALALPLGLGGLGLAVLALGECGSLNRAALVRALAVGAVLGIPGVWRAVRGGWVRGERVPFEAADRAFAVCLGLTVCGTLLTALAPVTDGDALCYHLQVPKLFLWWGAVGFEPDLHETVYPLLTEMLYAVALEFRGPVACRLVQWALGLAFALNVTALARPCLGRRAWWAGTVALLVPAVSNGMSAPLNDVALAAFGTAALHAWVRFHDRPGLRAALLTGSLTGLALGVKYPALVLAGLLGLAMGPSFLSRPFFRLAALGAGPTAWLARGRSRRAARAVLEAWAAEGVPAARKRRRRLAHALAFALAAWVVGGPWYLRAFAHTGNPVYPFFRSAFGGAGLDEVLAPGKRPMDPTAWNLATALGPMTLAPDRFDSFSHQFGPAFLLFLPALLVERPPRRVLLLSALGYAFLALCLTQRQSMRFVLIAVGPLSVGVAWLADSWWRRGTVPARALVVALGLVLAFESALAVARARHGLGVVLGRESAGPYLARREPTYVVGRWVGAHLPADARLIGQDHRGFYLPRDYAMELAHRRRTGLGTRGEGPVAIVATLRREGFTHLLMCPPEPAGAVEFDPTLGRLLGPWLAARDPLYREVLTDADGVARRYALYDLAGDALAARDRPDGGRTR